MILTPNLCYWIASKLVDFVDYDSNVNTINSATDDIRSSLLEDGEDLSSFFGRPIYGTLATWTPGAACVGNFNPWYVFFTNKRVANRLSNFKLASGRLRIKFLINGSPFHYGRMMISYIPLHAYDTCTIYPPSVDPQTVWPITASQRAKVFLDPSEGKGAELALPFVWPYDVMDLSTGDFANLGILQYVDLNTLKHANGATGSIQISYSIWMEDVNMAVPTTVNISGLTAQSAESLRPTIEVPPIASPRAGRDVIVECTCCSFGKRKKKEKEPLPFQGSPQANEEYTDSPVSGMASAVARSAGKLSSTPVIGKYALATSIGASAVSQIAKLFGFSKPLDMERPPARMIPRYVSELANSDGRDCSSKLSLDAKQELTIDPSVTGYSGGDELDIASIAARESFITQFTWSTAKTSGQLLWNSRVNPFMGSTPSLRHSPACEFAAMPFQYWRGNMAFRIQVVASRQHRGRLAIVWDPNYVVGLETNVLHTTIVDLDETRDVVVKIPWGQRSSYATCVPNVPLNVNYGTTAITTSDNTYSNGVIAIYCMNELAVPNSVTNNDVQVNIYACLCNAEFTSPGTYIASIGLINQSSETFTAPTEEETCAEQGELMASDTRTDNLSLVYFGEKISSFRQLFKRFALVSSDVLFKTGWTSSTANTCASVIRPKFPPFRGMYPTTNLQAYHVTGTLYENRTLNHFIPYVASAFLCSRGGMRAKFVFKNGNGTTFKKMSAFRFGARSTPGVVMSSYDDTTVTSATNPTVSYLTANNEFIHHTCDLTGTAITTINPILEVEYPYYFARRFDVPRDTNSTTAVGPTNLNNGVGEAGFRTNVEYVASSATAFPVLEIYAAAAEDFTLCWFQGMPPWSVYS